MSDPIMLIRARYVAPMDAPVIENGAIAISGERIVAVDSFPNLHRALSGTVTDLGDAVITPGLVNAHTHLELSNCACADAPASFLDWILSLPQRLGRDRLTPEEIFPPAVRHGIDECLRFGVTCVGDISQQMDLTRPILRDGPLRAVSYGEAIGLAQRRPRFEELLPKATDESHATDRLRIGLTPHAPYTVDIDGYRACAAIARERDLPLATHLAETPDEATFLSDHAGPFRDAYTILGYWNDNVPRFRGGPIRLAKEVGLLDYPTLLAHVNYCEHDELDLIAMGSASVVYCPRTHRYFGHPPHRWRDMLARGINVALGTDSCASSPSLNLLDDARLVHEIAPDVPAETLWQMITIRGARAIRMADQVGTLTPGKSADIAAFPTTHRDPLNDVLDNNVVPTATYIAGRRIPR